jgi:hypothetical protein
MIPQESPKSNAHDEHDREYCKLQSIPCKEVLSDNEQVGSDVLPRGSIKKGNFQQLLLLNFVIEEQSADRTPVKTHDDMNEEKEEEPAIIFFANGIVDPSTEMIISWNILMVLEPIKLAARDPNLFCCFAPFVWHKHEIVIGIMIKSLERLWCDDPR